jgi:cysteine synthase
VNVHLKLERREGVACGISSAAASATAVFMLTYR